MEMTRKHATAQSGTERRGLYRLPGDDVNPLSRLGIAAERLRSPSVSAPHRESLARPTGPGLLTYLIVPKVPKGVGTVIVLFPAPRTQIFMQGATGRRKFRFVAELRLKPAAGAPPPDGTEGERPGTPAAAPRAGRRARRRDDFFMRGGDIHFG